MPTMGAARFWGPDATRRFDALALLVLAALAALAVWTYEDYGLGWDDYTHAQYGDLLLSLYGSGFRDIRAFSFVNLYMYGGGFDILAALAGKLFPNDVFEIRRLLGAAIGIAGLVLVWRMGRRIGGPLAGLCALLFLALCPLYYGHMYINAKDAPFAFTTIVLLYAILGVIETYPDTPPRRLALLGIGTGLAVGTRILGALGVVETACGLALLALDDARRAGLREAAPRLGRFILMLLPAVALAWLVMGLVWPWAMLSPLNIFKAAAYFAHFFEKPWKELFGGQLIDVPDMPWTYLPTLLSLKFPEAMLIFGGAGLVMAAVMVLRRRGEARPRAIWLVLLLSALLPVAIAMANRPAMYNGLRHFVFITPALALLAGLAAAALVEAAARKSAVLALLAALPIVIGFALPLHDMEALHPYEYTYFNRLAGSVKGADSRYMLDYWGLAFKQASEELREKLDDLHLTPPAGRKWKIAVCGPQRPAEVELGDNFAVGWDSRGADFAMMLGEFYCRELDAPVLVEIERDGVVYARVYDIRGKNISSVLTIPAP